jgi:hypothetical protein
MNTTKTNMTFSGKKVRRLARRRMIDPNIWGSEDMAKLTIRQRLLVIGLFSNSDDHGKGKANPAYIRSLVFPYDDIKLSDITEDLKIIDSIISVDFYEVEGNSYYKFIHWSKWQTVQKPQESIIPDPVKNESRMSQEPFSPKGKERKGSRKEEKGKEEKGIESDNSHKDYIQELLKKCKIEDITIYSLDTIFSYIGMVDIEVIETAIKKSEGKHINYAIKILKGMVEEGITTKEQVKHKPPDKTKFKKLGTSGKPKIPIVSSQPKSVSDEEYQRILDKANRLETG